MNPLGEYTPDDWIVRIVFFDGSTKRFGASPQTDDDEAVKMALRLVPEERRSQVSDVQVCRRKDVATQPDLTRLRI